MPYLRAPASTPVGQVPVDARPHDEFETSQFPRRLCRTQSHPSENGAEIDGAMSHQTFVQGLALTSFL